MPTKTHCPACAKKISLPDHLAGKRCRCPACGHAFVAPVAAPKAKAVPPPLPPRPTPPSAPVAAPLVAPVAAVPTPETPVAPKRRPVKRSSRMPLVVVMVVMTILLGGGGFYFFKVYNQQREQARVVGTPWEIQNKDKLRALKAEADALADAHQLQDAFDKYTAIADLLDGKGINDPEVIAINEATRSARRSLVGEIANERKAAAAATRRTVAVAPRATQPTTAGAVASVTPPDAPAVTAPPATATDDPAKPPATDAPPAPVKQPTTAPIDVALASTRPAGSQDEAERLRDVFNTLLHDGTNALVAGEFRAALESLQDARQLFEKKMRGKSASFGGPEHVALLHGLALGYQLTGKPERASPLFDVNTPLDKACAAKGVSRQLLVTRAALDATQGYLAMRTVVSLTAYLKEHPDELDSEVLDLLFSALQKADERVTNRALMLDPSIKLYEAYNARLEATRPGQKRWGVKWVSGAQFEIEMRRRRDAVAAFDRAAQREDQAVATVNAATASLDAAKRSSSRAAINSAVNRLEQAQSDRVRATKLAAEAKAAIPAVPALGKDDFQRLLTPRDVEVVVSPTAKAATGGTAVASADAVRPIRFSLGGGGAAPPSEGTARPVNPAAPASVYDPIPTAAAPARRTFSRSATAFAVAPDLFLTTAAAVSGARRIVIEFPNATPVDAVVERVGDDGLALIRVTGTKVSYVNVAAADFAGGNVLCPAFPDVSIFGLTKETIAGKALAASDQGWRVSLTKHPRLPGAPLLDESGNLVGVEVGDRDDPADRVPALTARKVAAFIGADAPAKPCPTPADAAVVQVTAVFER